MAMELLERLFSLKGKTALITGGYKGIGRAIAETYAEAGADVAVVARNLHGCEEAAREIAGKYGVRAVGKSLDVNDSKRVDQVVQEIVGEVGRIDILVNNAGILDATPMLDLSVEAWDNLIDINLRGMQLCTQESLRHMLGQGSGKIIFMASRAGEMGSPKVAPSYSASKGGALALAKSYALYCAPFNINCNAIAPGYIETDMTQGRDDPKSVPIQRLGTSLDVAKSVYFLASDLSDYITGAVIDVNGGLYIR